MDINKLYDKKAKYLQEILSISESIKFTDDVESNVNKYNSLFNRRKIIFEKVYEVDKEIKAMHPGKPIFDGNIKDIADQIIKIDSAHRDKIAEFRIYLSDKIKGYKQGRKAREKFNPYSKNDISTFESKA